jgi:hypothetical protein
MDYNSQSILSKLCIVGLGALSISLLVLTLVPIVSLMKEVPKNKAHLMKGALESHSLRSEILDKGPPDSLDR